MKKSGFTLIEMVIYLALFSIIMLGIIVIFYQFSQYSVKNMSKLQVIEEINFVLKKIDWALIGASDILILETSELRIINLNITTDQISIRLNPINNEDFIEMCLEECDDVNNFFPLTTKNVKVNNFFFDLLFSPDGIKKGVKITIIINEIKIEYLKYLR